MLYFILFYLFQDFTNDLTRHESRIFFQLLVLTVDSMFFYFYCADPWFLQMNVKKRYAQIKKQLALMESREAEWSESVLVENVLELVREIHLAFAYNDREKLKRLMSPEVFIKLEGKLELNTFFQNETPEVEVDVNNLMVVHVENYIKDSKDNFTIYIKAKVFIRPKNPTSPHRGIPAKIHGFWTLNRPSEEWQLAKMTSVQGWRKYLKNEIRYENTFQL